MFSCVTHKVDYLYIGTFLAGEAICPIVSGMMLFLRIFCKIAFGVSRLYRSRLHLNRSNFNLPTNHTLKMILVTY